MAEQKIFVAASLMQLWGCIMQQGCSGARCHILRIQAADMHNGQQTAERQSVFLQWFERYEIAEGVDRPEKRGLRMVGVQHCQKHEEQGKKDVERDAAALWGQGAVFATEKMSPVDGGGLLVVVTHGVCFSELRFLQQTKLGRRQGATI